MIFLKPVKSAGFCGGVKRSIQIARNAKDHTRSSVYTNGPLIHNPSMIQQLEKEGIKVFEAEQTVLTIVSRSHGTGKTEEQYLKAHCNQFVDATCPYVKKIHHKIEQEAKREILIIGKKNHPEVKAFLDRGKKVKAVLETPEDIVQLAKDPQNYKEEYIVLVQTTYSPQEYQNMVETLQRFKFCFEAENTICHSVFQRQKETREIAEMADYMLVLGGKNSSNTQELFMLAKQYCKQVFYCENPDEIAQVVLPLHQDITLGITAGASTPPEHIMMAIQELKKRYRNCILKG